MNATQIRNEIAACRTNNGFIHIRGYRSNSGRIANVTLQPLGEGGYHRLIRESIQQVESGQVTKPQGIEQGVWEDAIASQLASWHKTLNGGHGRANNYNKDDKAFYTHSEQGDTITVRNVRIISKTVLVEGEYKAVKSRPLTIAKRKLVKQTPVANYQGSFKLEVGKFDRIRFDGNQIDGE